jgi:hypothetical protein
MDERLAALCPKDGLVFYNRMQLCANKSNHGCSCALEKAAEFTMIEVGNRC